MSYPTFGDYLVSLIMNILIVLFLVVVCLKFSECFQAGLIAASGLLQSERQIGLYHRNEVQCSELSAHCKVVQSSSVTLWGSAVQFSVVYGSTVYFTALHRNSVQCGALCSQV